MESHEVGSRLGKTPEVLLRLHYHQMYIEKLRARPTDGFHHRKAERYVGHEDAVHDVDVYPLRGTFVNHPRVAVEVAEVGRKHRRGDNAFHGVLKHLHKGKAISEKNG